MSKKVTNLILVAALCLMVIAQHGASADEKGLFPMIVVAVDGTGDFGPSTSGTTTAGIQEALNYCVANKKDLYIKGGPGGSTYNVSSTIHIPASQDFRIDGGTYTVNWVGPSNQDMLLVDSGEDAHYYLGQFVYSGTGNAVHVYPANPTHLDHACTFIDSELRIACVKAGAIKTGTGVLIESNTAGWGIGQCDFFFGNIEGFATGLKLADATPGVMHMRLESVSIHTDVNNATLMKIGTTGCQNAIKVGLGVDGSATGVKGIDLYGDNNTIDAVLRGGFSAGNAVVFEMASAANQVRLVQDPSISDATTLVTDSSSYTTNQITWTGGPIPVRSVSVSSGVYTYTQRLYPGTAKISGGTVSNVELIRGGTSISYGSAPGDVLLSVGDQLRITSSAAPTLQIIPRQNG